MADKLKIIEVRGAGKDNRVVLWEVDERHPGGEAFVSNKENETVKVAETKAVRRLLGEERLVLVEAKTRAKKEDGKKEDDNNTPPTPPAF